MAETGVIGCDDAAQALKDAALVLSLVTADQALGVAHRCAPLLGPNAIYCDMNSVAPGTKRAAAKVVEAAGARYVDVAIMAPVNPQRFAVPLLLCGSAAADAVVALEACGFSRLSIVGEEIGRAATIKMLRSVMYKGMEALTAECLIACERAGVTEEVMASFGGNDWAGGADYRLDRMLVHGLRRAAELREVCKTIEDLDLPPLMSGSTAIWQQAMSEIQLKPVPEGLTAKLEAVATAMEGKTRI